MSGSSTKMEKFSTANSYAPCAGRIAQDCRSRSLKLAALA
jgi:hypothetical protein